MSFDIIRSLKKMFALKRPIFVSNNYFCMPPTTTTTQLRQLNYDNSTIYSKKRSLFSSAKYEIVIEFVSLYEFHQPIVHMHYFLDVTHSPNLFQGQYVVSDQHDETGHDAHLVHSTSCYIHQLTR